MRRYFTDDARYRDVDSPMARSSICWRRYRHYVGPARSPAARTPALHALGNGRDYGASLAGREFIGDYADYSPAINKRILSSLITPVFERRS